MPKEVSPERVAAIAAEWKEHDAMVRHDTAAVA